MGKVIRTTGKKAELPYKVEMIDREVYTIEELCYSLFQCAEIMDKRIVSEELIDWIGTSCGLPSLAEKLAQIARRNGKGDTDKKKLTDFVMKIQEEVGYLPPAQQEELRRTMLQSEGLRPYERYVEEAEDSVLEGRREEAQNLYDEILQGLPDLERGMRSQVWKRKGILYADGFDYKEAGKCFRKAWDLVPDEESGFYLMAAYRLTCTEEEYDRFASSHPELYSAAREVKARIAEAENAYRLGSESRQIRHLQKYKKDGQQSAFDANLRHRVKELCERYRLQNCSPF